MTMPNRTADLLVLAAYAPLVLVILLTAVLHTRWAWLIRREVKFKTRYHLVTGIAVAYWALFVEQGRGLFLRLREAGFLSNPDGLSFSGDFAILLTIKLGLLIGALIHLHAYWNAANGRSWGPYVALVSSCIWGLAFIALEAWAELSGINP